MLRPPNLLNDDGTASIATAVMMSHHGFRRDLGRFARALRAFDAARTDALRAEWRSFHFHLHGHHEAEDRGMFPSIVAQAASVASTIDKLTADHRQIDPLLERGDRAFAELPAAVEGAATVVHELRTLLDAHLAIEEAELIPFLRAARNFPPPSTEAEAELYAEGFAWAMQGVARDVLDPVYAMLPQVLLAKLPAAQAAFQARCDRVWGRLAVGATRTPIPDA
jgi:hypothetical protein